MAGEEMAKEISDRRRRSRAGSNLNVNFNGGGVVLLIGAAAGALFASAFAAYRIRAHKRRRGSMTDGIQGDSDEHLASLEAKEFVGDEGDEGDGANTEEGVVQVISHENFDASVQISQFDKKEMDFYLLEEGKIEVRERSPTADIELVDGDHEKLVDCRDSNADTSSSPANACGNLGIGNSFGENQIRCDDEELVAASIKEERKTSFINCKEDDEEDNKKAYLEEWCEGEEIEENLTSSNLYSEQPRLIEIGSSPANVYYNLGFDSSLGEDQLRYGDEQLVIDSVSEVGEAPCKNSKEDEEEDTKKAYIEWSEGGELEEKITSNLNTEELRLLEKKTFQILEMVIAVEERKLEDEFKDEMYNSIQEFVLSRDKEIATRSPFGDQDKMNSLIEEIEPFFEGSGEAKKVLDMTQNDSGKFPEMVIMEDEIKVESGSFKDAERLDILCVEQDNENGDASDDKMVEGSRGLNEQTLALPQESSFTAISELETSSPKDSIIVKAKEDVHLIAPINDIVHIEEDKMVVDESNYLSADEGVERLIEEIQGTRHPPIGSPLKEEAWLIESCVRDNPAMIIAVEEKAQLEDNTTDVILDGKAEENLLNGFEEDVESSETEKNLRENGECPLTEYQRIEFSLEQDKIQFQGIEPISREEKTCLEDWCPLSLEPNIKVVQPLQLDNNFSNSDKTLEREECYLEAGAEVLGTALNEEVDEREDETNSVQYHELETRQYIKIHKEPQSQITGEEDEEEQILKHSFDLVEKGAKIVAKTIKQDTKIELIDVDKKHQRQVGGHENIVSSKGKQQRTATKKVKGIECTFMGYSNGHIFLVTTLATAFAILAFLYTKDFFTRTNILENFISG